MLYTISLKQNSDFLRLYKRGKSFVSPGLVLYISKNRRGENRMGITTGKKVGIAVKRNRARRIIREAYRGMEPEIAKGYDFVFVARGRTPGLKTGELSKSMRNLFVSAGVIRK